MINLSVIGHLTKDAEARNAGGKNVINFTVATSVGYADKKTTIYVDCAQWTEKTGVLPYLKKGTQVYVEGEPSLRSWESNGKSGTSLQLRVGQLELLGGGKNNQSSDDSGSASQAEMSQREANRAQVPQDEPLDDLPF